MVTYSSFVLEVSISLIVFYHKVEKQLFQDWGHLQESVYTLQSQSFLFGSQTAGLHAKDPSRKFGP